MEQEAQFHGDPPVYNYANTPTTPLETAYPLADRRSAASDDLPADPHDFYRPYTPQRNGRPDIIVENNLNGMPTASQAQARSRQLGAQPRASAFGAPASRSRVRSTSTPSLSAAASAKPGLTTPGGRSTSGGVRALAARFEQNGPGKPFTTQSPGRHQRQKPVPTFKAVAGSPTQTASSSFPPPNAERSGTRGAHGSHPGAESNGTSTESAVYPQYRRASDQQYVEAGSSRMPLFGEVLLGQYNAQSPGYGIQAFVDKHDGSDGNVLPRARIQSSMDPSKIDSAYDPSYSRPASSSDHPPTQSDINGMPYLDALENPFEDAGLSTTALGDSSKRQYVSASSRIPVFAKTSRSPSDSFNSSQNPRYATGTESSRSRHIHPPTSSNASTSIPAKDHHSHKRPVTPEHVLSSRRYEPSSRSGSGSTQRLKAQIQIPLPKKSPPLRSSRPRAPVSSAASTVSREISHDMSSGDIVEPGSPLSGYGHTGQRTEVEAHEFAARTTQLQEAPEYDGASYFASPRGHYHKRSVPSLSLNTGDTVAVESLSNDTDIEVDESPILGVAGGLPSIRNHEPGMENTTYAHGTAFDAAEATGSGHILPGSITGQQVSGLDDSGYGEHSELSISNLVAGLRNRRGSSTSRTDFTGSPELDEASVLIGLGATPRPLEQNWGVMQHSADAMSHDQRTNSFNGRRMSGSEHTVFESAEETLPSPSEANCSVAPDDSISMVAHPRNRSSSLAYGQASRTLALTSDARSVVNRVLEEYYQGYVTPEMASGFQQQVEAVTPHMSRHTEWQSIEATQEYLHNILTARPGNLRPAKNPVRDPAPWLRTPEPRFFEDLDRSPPDGGHGTAIIFRNSDLHLDSSASPSVDSLSKHAHSGSTSTLRPPFGRMVSDPEPSQPHPPPQTDPKSFGAVDLVLSNAPSPLDLLASRLSADVNISDFHSSGKSLGLGIQATPATGELEPTPPAPDYHPPPPPAGDASHDDLVQGINGEISPTSPDRYPQRKSSLLLNSRPVSLDVESHHSRQRSMELVRDPSEPRITAAPSLADIVSAAAIEQATPDSDPKKAQKDLRMRHHTIDELINTEYSFHQDMTIFEDIYKATSFNLKTMNDILTHEDRTLIFRNSDEIRNFGRRFHRELKKAAGEVYKPPTDDRINGMKRESDATQDSVATNQTEQSNSAPESEQAKVEADRQTSIGRVFVENLEEMGKVFGHFLQHQDAAQRRAVQVAKEANVQRWLEECRTTSVDLTNAWNLDSFILKPFQRLCKYPLLLKQIIGVTPKDHPDYLDLEKALEGVHALIKNVDEEKRRADTLRDIFAKKPRKDSIDKSGIRKVLPWNVRNVEKIKEQQKVQANVKAVDPDYEHVAQRFGGHFFQLQIVIRDIEKYVETLRDSMIQYMRFVDGLHEMCQGPTLEDWTSMQAACYSHIRAVKEINKKLLPQHIKNVKEKVIQPIITCWDLHHKTQKCMAKRKKRVPFYLKWQEAIAKGVKPDKEVEAVGSEFKALNDSLKNELPKLYALCRTLVENCLRNFIDLQLLWITHWETACQPIYGVDQYSASLSMDIASAAKKYLAAHSEMAYRVSNMAIVNGTAFHDITNFMVPVRDQLDDSFIQAVKSRSQSNLSERSPSFPAVNRPNYFGDIRRQSAGPIHSPVQPLFSPHEVSSQSSPKPRPRASSTQQPLTPHSGSTKFWSAPQTHSAGPSRPQTSSGRTDSLTGGPPRLTLDLHQEEYHSIGLNLNTPDQLFPKSTNPFISALPMSDSPVDVTPPETDEESIDRPVMFLAASLFEFNIDNSHTEGGLPYLRYVPGEIFDVIGLKGELWLARNQDDPAGLIGWIWEKHFARILPETE